MRNPLLHFLIVLLFAAVFNSCVERPTEPEAEAVVDPTYATTKTSTAMLGPRLHAVLRRELSQSIPNNTVTAIAWDVEDADFGDLHVTGATGVTLGPGTWLLITVVNFHADPDGSREVFMGTSPGNRVLAASSIQGGNSAQTLTATYVSSVPAGGTRTYSVEVSHTAGNSLNVQGERFSYFMVVQLDPVPLGSQPYVRLGKSSHQSILNSTTTALTWNVELEDPWNLHNTGAPTVTIGSGIWLLSPSVIWAGNSSGIRETRIAENGTQIGNASSSRQGGSSWQSTNLPLVRVVPSGETRNYEIRGLQTSGANLNVLSRTCAFGICFYHSHLSVAQLNPDWLGPIGILRMVSDQSVPYATFVRIGAFTAEQCTGAPSITCGSSGMELGPGVWLLIAIVNWQANASGFRQVIIQGGEGLLGSSVSTITGGGSPQSTILPLVRVIPAGSPNRLHDVVGYQTSGGSLNVLGGNTYFIAVQLATL